VSFLSFVKNYSGGAWTGDSYEHWERALYFLRMWGHDRAFIGLYQLPARPPLANVLAAGFLRLTSVDYAHYQIVTTALCSLAYLPVGLLALRFGGARAARMAALILMVNPLFIQNATYPWTKLQAAAFVLGGLYFLLRVRDGGPQRGPCAALCGLLFGGALVTHYSAGPYAAAAAAAWLVMAWRSGRGGRLWGGAAAAAVAGACVALPWFLWSTGEYGLRSTLLSNTTVSMMQKVPGSLLVKMALNLRDTLIPPQLRGFHGTLFLQSSPWGALRDQAFIVYQLNLLLALGSVGFAATLREAARAWKAAPAGARAFWPAFLGCVVALSLAAYGDRDHYGIAHICLQPVILLALAFLASRWASLGPAWRAALAAGWAADFCLGIALQFAVEDFAIDRWLTPGRSLLEVSATYSGVSQENLAEKIIAHDAYFSDILPTRPAFVLVLMGALLCLALLRAVRSQPGPA
jgi:4-amino-4-deoxy-L-arabinose transferase-like glycosyltransferase